MVVKIPVYNDMSEIVEYATVDEQDKAKVSRYRWFLSKDGYACTNVDVGKRSIIIKMSSIVLDLVVPVKPGSVKHRITTRYSTCNHFP